MANAKAPKTLSKTKLYKVKCIGIVHYSVRPFSTRYEGLHSPVRPSFWISPKKVNLLKIVDTAPRGSNHDSFKKLFYITSF